MGRRRAFAAERDEPVRRLQRLDTADRDEANPAQAELLRLQRSGGNEAVAGVLARDDTKTKAPPPPRKYGPEEQTPEKPRTMKIDGVGDVPLLAVSTPRKDGNDVTVTIGSDSPFLVELQRRAATGGGLGKVVIDFGYMQWTLGDVYVGSVDVRTSEGTASITLNYASLSIGTTADEPPGKVE